MAGQQGNTPPNTLSFRKYGSLVTEPDRIRIEQLGIDQRIEIHAEERRVNERALDRFNTEQDILTGKRTAILKARIFADLECIGQFVLGNFRSRLGNVAVGCPECADRGSTKLQKYIRLSRSKPRHCWSAD